MRVSFLFCLILLLAACKGGDPLVETGGRAFPAYKGGHSGAFNRSFQRLIDAYYQLGEGLAGQDDSLIAQSARRLKSAADSLPLAELKADTALFSSVSGYTQAIGSETQGLMGEAAPGGKRRSYQMMSDLLFDLLRMLRYDQRPVYRWYCATAFDDQGAYWLADSTVARNPYNGGKNGDGSSIKDTIDFRMK